MKSLWLLAASLATVQADMVITFFGNADCFGGEAYYIADPNCNKPEGMESGYNALSVQFYGVPAGYSVYFFTDTNPTCDTSTSRNHNWMFWTAGGTEYECHNLDQNKNGNWQIAKIVKGSDSVLKSSKMRHKLHHPHD